MVGLRQIWGENSRPPPSSVAKGDSRPSPTTPPCCLNIFSGCAVGSAGWADDPWGAAAGAAARAAGARPKILSLISAAIWFTRVTIPPASSLCSKKLSTGLAPLTSTILESTLMLLPSTVRLPYRR